MKWSQISGSGGETDLVAKSSLAAFQWEAAMDDQGCFGAQTAWPESGLTTEGHWLAEIWHQLQESLPPARQRSLMSPGQALALWRQVIESSAPGEQLLDRVSIARACAVTRRVLLDYEVSPADRGGPGWFGDPEIFLGWERRFDAILENRRWLDPASLSYRIGRTELAPRRDAFLLDAEPLTPVMRQLQRRWHASGRKFEAIEPPTVAATVQASIARDTNEEVRSVVEWVGAMLEASSDARLAIVVPDLAQRRAEMTHRLAQAIGHERVWAELGQSIRETGPFGAAVSALSLLSQRSGFAALSRWLRSPFFAADRDPSRTLDLERRLRHEHRVEEAFVEAYRLHGLRREIFEALPDEAGRLDRALERIPTRATPTAWVAIWQACLRELGWTGPSVASVEGAAAWDSALASIAELTPIVGEMDGASALTELEAVVSAQTVFRPPIASGVHLLGRISEVGPGYAGVWVMGFSDQVWPEPPESQPLVPWTVRVARGMPGANPEQTLERARSLLDRLLKRSPIVRFSCPARLADEPLTPCMHVAPWTRPPKGKIQPTPTGFASARVGSRMRLRVQDPAPPHLNDRIRGGARTLDLQATCPVRAFCETRLGASPLEPAIRGLAPWLRGLLVHRTLELLLEPAEVDPPNRRIDQSIAAAFLELTREGSPLWNVQLEIERERIRKLIEAFLILEDERDPFLTVDLERRGEIIVAGRTLRCRIDRIDRLSTGAQVLIDYKTGRRLPSGWFDDRLTDAQLPLYAQQFPDSVGAIVGIRLGAEKVEYRAAGSSAGCVPGRQSVFDDEAQWRAQITRWREQLKGLIEEYVAGDTRVRIAGVAAADGAYAPLTRIKAYLS